MPSVFFVELVWVVSPIAACSPRLVTVSYPVVDLLIWWFGWILHHSLIWSHRYQRLVMPVVLRLDRWAGSPWIAFTTMAHSALTEMWATANLDCAVLIVQLFQSRCNWERALWVSMFSREVKGNNSFASQLNLLLPETMQSLSLRTWLIGRSHSGPII